ncbi:AAA family ATPase [Heyndrickxia ginsengihumi]|uniref:AAA family ATPase n=1 Tax=Heyndrickxia ginsengihumi TaxID=363870 RepID=UPI00046EE562|nr:AAA family ATPase [Heyndrickxia ginsengihumi]
MTTIKLLNLTLKNFKGVRQFELRVNGNNADVYGDNATGKTTLFDAFNYLLFDKDSQNKKDFSLKTRDKDGQEIHNLEHEVEAILLVDDTQLSLKKVFKEKWSKKRGAVTPEFTGHTTDYYVDGVPKKKKEYQDVVSSMIDERIFKLLTSPTYFNEQLKPEERRKTLMEVCGEIKDEEIIASNKALDKLSSILNGKTIEDLRKIINSRKSKINKELEMIPIRIDELLRSLPELNGLDKESLESQINAINAQIDEKQTLINNIKNGNAISDKERQIKEIDLELMDIQRNHNSDTKEQLYKTKARLQEEESNLKILQSKLENLKNQKRYNDENLKRVEVQILKLKEEWFDVNNQVFQHNDDCTCPTCGQDLPAEQVESAREKALAEFNLKKSKKLESIDSKGKELTSQKKEILAENEKLKSEYDKISAQVEDKRKLVEKLQAQLSEQESQVTDVLENAAYINKLESKKSIEKEIQKLRNESAGAIQSVQIEIMDLRDKRDTLQKEIGNITRVEEAKERIAELEEEQKRLAAEYEKLEHELFLTEEFIRTKVSFLEERINSKFKYARFELFEKQINGGLNEVCNATYNGVPYGTGLNNAARINVGLDIINTLSEYYGFSAPIFIDNREAVTKLIDTNAQTISLIVSEADKELRVKTIKEEVAV